MKILVVTPTYNEKENIEDLIFEILSLDIGAEVLVVDDNSPDGTGDLVDALAAKSPRIHIIHRAGKLGLGTAYIEGFKYHLDYGADLIVQMDADFSHHPRYIPALVKLCKESCDVTIGSRYVPGGATSGWPIHRRILSATANFITRTALGLKAHDCTAGFRCYRRNALEKIDLDTIKSSGYSFLFELLYRCQQAGLKIGEVPITFENRTRGTSKISKKEIFQAIRSLYRLKTGR